MDIEAWLGELGLREYAPVFRDNDVDPGGSFQADLPGPAREGHVDRPSAP